MSNKPTLVPLNDQERTTLLTMADVLQEYVCRYPAFVVKPLGAPGSQARLNQIKDYARQLVALELLGRIEKPKPLDTGEPEFRGGREL